MKKLKLFLPALLLSLLANSQAGQINQINIISFTVKPVLPGTIDNWMSTPGALVLIAQKVPNPRMVEPRLVIQIRSGSAVMCGNNAATAKQVDPFDVRTFNTTDLTGFLTNCHELKEGTYTICAQFFNIDKIAISREVCKDFRVEATNIEYAPPTLITPDNSKKFTPQELQGVVMFRWTPLVPKPKEPVTYRLKVWQLMQGQSGSQAMRTNQPIVTKDVDNITQATVSGIYTGPCRPPYLCDFIWQVQALNRSGKPMGNNNGNSEPYTFGIAEAQIIGPENTLPEDKKQITSGEAMKGVTFRWTPVTPKPQEPVTYRMKVWQLMQGQSGSQAMKTNPPIVTRDVMDITEASVSNIYTGPCRPPYLCDFIWEVQAVTRTGTTLGTSHPTEFNVKGAQITGPENTFPEDKKEFTSGEAMKGVTFRWTPVVPKPQEPVTYRMKVWQLMQGQSGSQAMRTNPPIVTKDVDNITQAVVNNIYTGPCRPPYLCDFIWMVEASTQQAGAVPKIIGTSESTTFRVAEETGKCPANLFPEDKKKFTLEEAKKEMIFKWTPLVPKPQEPVTYRMKVWQLMQGQSGSQAMKTNQPIVTKDVDNLTQASVSGIYTGPCRPPYLCDFIWMVEAVSKDGHTGCAGEPTAFSVTEENVKCPANLFPEDKKKLTPEEAKKEMLFRWTPIVPKPQEPVTYRMKVWQLMQGQSGSQAMKTNQPIVTKDVDNITQATVSGIYTGPCRPPYLCDFIWMVEAVSKDGHTGCAGEPTAFSVTEENVKCPANLFPEDKKKFKSNEIKQSVTFRWTPVVPKPQEPVTYRLKVWQLMQGQNGSQAMRTNKPIVTKDVADITEATVSGIYTGPCRPPYLCDFVWMVEAIGKDGQTTCTGESSAFSIAGNDIDIQIDSVYVSCCGSNGMQNVYIKIKNNLSNTVKITNLNIDKVNGVANVISITGLSPVLPVNIPGLGSQAFTGTIKCIDTARTIRFFVRAEDAADNAITETEVETDTLNCPCDPCRSMGVTVTGDKLTTISSSSNEVTLSGILSGLDPNKVKKVTIELVYFNITQTGDSNCAKCAENKEWGNFIPPASHSFNGFGNPVLNGGNFGREWTWISTSDKVCNDGGTGGGHDNGKALGCATCGTAPNPANNNQEKNVTGEPNNNIVINPGGGIPKGNGFSLPIAVPPGPALSCCGDKIKICIRYTWWDFCCHACDVIKCYEIERKPK